MSLSGTHQKREPFCPKGSPKLFFCVICSFLYILDLSAFVVGGRTETMHKKLTFYTYAIEQQTWLFLQINVNI